MGLVSPRIPASPPTLWSVLPISYWVYHKLGRSDWVYHKLCNTPVLRSGTGSWVLSGLSDVRHPLSPVIRLGLRNPKKKNTANPTWGHFRMLFQSSKLEARTSLLSRFSVKRPSSFELWALKELSKMSPHVRLTVLQRIPIPIWGSYLSVTDDRVLVYLNNHGTGFLGPNQTNKSFGTQSKLELANSNFEFAD